MPGLRDTLSTYRGKKQGVWFIRFLENSLIIRCRHGAMPVSNEDWQKMVIFSKVAKDREVGLLIDFV
jgi:hypothetical protein